MGIYHAISKFCFNIVVLIFLYYVNNYIYLSGQRLAYDRMESLITKEKDINKIRTEFRKLQNLQY